jgi:catechol 2,3-dioxygenase-like lactoylglutathione lyase family enzyme
VFFRCGDGVLLLFNPDVTSATPGAVAGTPVPAHGALGVGHVAFAVAEREIPDWRAHLGDHGVAIESEIEWPRGGTSLYVRDPAGNSVELAPRRIWGLAEKTPTAEGTATPTAGLHP